MNDFPSQLRWYSLTLAILALGWVAFLATRTESLPVLPLLVLGALAVFSEHRAVRLPSGVTISGGFMVTMASIVVFAETGPLLAPLLVGMASGLHVGYLRRGRRGWIAFNAGNVGLSTLAGAAVYAGLRDRVTSDLPVALVAAVPVMLAAVGTGSLVIVGSFLAERQADNARSLFRDLRPVFLQALPFAVLGFAIGHLQLVHGSFVFLLLVAPILIAREVFSTYVGIHEAHEASLSMLLDVLHVKDEYTAGHAERVARYARYMGEELGFTPARLERLRYAALMHDIGKLAVPNHLLNKPSSLTPEEYERVKLHDEMSVEMLSMIDFLAPIAHAVDVDRARSGGDDPSPIEPHIIAVADAYDAMTSTRAYRRALSQAVAFRELQDNAGRQFHPECVTALISALEARGERHGPGYEEETVRYAVPPPVVGVGSAGLGDLVTPGGLT